MLSVKKKRLLAGAGAKSSSVGAAAAAAAAAAGLRENAVAEGGGGDATALRLRSCTGSSPGCFSPPVEAKCTAWRLLELLLLERPRGWAGWSMRWVLALLMEDPAAVVVFGITGLMVKFKQPGGEADEEDSRSVCW